MGIFGFGNYSKPGPGIDKNAPKKKGLNLFYDIALRKFWDIIKLNLLYIVTILPHLVIVMFLSGGIAAEVTQSATAFITNSGAAMDEEYAQLIMFIDLGVRLLCAFAYTVFFGAGPCTAGFVYILRAFINEQPVFLASDYFKAVKANFKQGVALWITDIVIFTVVYCAGRFYTQVPPPMSYMKYAMYMLMFFYTILHLFIYHLMIGYEMPFGKLFKNSALFAIPSFPYALMVLALNGFIVFIFPGIATTSPSETIVRIFATVTVVVWICLLFGVCGLITEFNACMQVKKYIKEDPGVEEKKSIHSR